MEGEGQLLGGLACALCPVYNLFLHPSAWNMYVIADTTSWPAPRRRAFSTKRQESRCLMQRRVIPGLELLMEQK